MQMGKKPRVSWGVVCKGCRYNVRMERKNEECIWVEIIDTKKGAIFYRRGVCKIIDGVRVFWVVFGGMEFLVDKLLGITDDVE